MRNMKSTRSATIVAAAFAMIFAGCSDAQKQDWNEFWGVNSGPKRAVKSTPNQQKPQPQTASAKQPAKKPPQPAKADAPKTDDQKAEEVDQDVGAYSAQMNTTPRETENKPSDHSSKIKRQHDPERQKRIKEAAAKEQNGQEPATANSGTAMKRYKDNTSAKGEDSAAQPAVSGDGDVEVAHAPNEKKSVVKKASAKDIEASNTVDDETGTSHEHANVPDGTTPAGSNATEEPIAIDHDKPVKDIASNNSNSGDEGDEPAEKATIQANSSHANGTKSNPTEAKGGAKKGVPELAEMSVSAAPEPEARPANDEPKPVATMANTSGSAANSEPTFAVRITEQEKLVSSDPNNLEEQYRLRMMYLIDGQDEKAKAEIPGVDADLQQIIGAQIASLISARSTSGRDPATWATRQLESIEELRRLVKERADLVVTKVALCTAVEGFGRYKPIEPAEFKAGKKHRVVIYIEIDNFSCVPLNSGMYRTLLSVRQTLLTKDGKEIWSEKADNIEDLARRPRRDFYLCTTPIAIPKTLPPGDYLLKAEVEDVLAGKINSGVATFQIVP